MAWSTILRFFRSLLARDLAPVLRKLDALILTTERLEKQMAASLALVEEFKGLITQDNADTVRVLEVLTSQTDKIAQLVQQLIDAQNGTDQAFVTAAAEAIGNANDNLKHSHEVLATALEAILHPPIPEPVPEPAPEGETNIGTGEAGG